MQVIEGRELECQIIDLFGTIFAHAVDLSQLTFMLCHLDMHGAIALNDFRMTSEGVKQLELNRGFRQSDRFVLRVEIDQFASHLPQGAHRDRLIIDPALRASALGNPSPDDDLAIFDFHVGHCSDAGCTR